MFVDKTRIIIKAGNGGDGKVNFYRDTFTMHGGPDGGDGGKGGDIIFVADSGLNNLVDYYYTKKFRAGDGENGGASKAYGKSGDDVILKVPCGTIIRDAETGKVIADMVNPNEKVTILRGGLGGRGNSKFANSRRQSPTFSESGEKTKEYAEISNVLINKMLLKYDTGIKKKECVDLTLKIIFFYIVNMVKNDK